MHFYTSGKAKDPGTFRGTEHQPSTKGTTGYNGYLNFVEILEHALATDKNVYFESRGIPQ